MSRELLQQALDALEGTDLGQHYQTITALREALAAPPAAPAPAGWVMVPREPTQKMERAGNDVGLMGMSSLGSGAVYRAMIAASPAAPAVREREPLPEVLQQVIAELDRATRKFPTWPTDPMHALAVLGEEFGELTKAMLQFTYEPHKKVARTDIREEAIQTAAMALRLAMSLPVYDYAPSRQHKQAAHGVTGGKP